MRLTPNQEKALTLNRHVCVTAGAGSGKTTILVERYLKILTETGATPREIVAITFTEKAAAEMKARITERLDALNVFPGKASLQEQMATVPISTIHAFCSSLLREFPFAAGVPADFGILQGIEAKLLQQKTLQTELHDIATERRHGLHGTMRYLLHRCGGPKKLQMLLRAMLNQREVIEQLIEEFYSRHTDAEIRALWEKLSTEQLLKAVQTGESVKKGEGWIHQWIHSLYAILRVAKGKNASDVRNLTEQLRAEAAASTQLPQLREIADLILTKSGGIAKKDFLGSRVDTNAIENEIKFLVSAAKKLRHVPPLNTDDDALIRRTRKLLCFYTHIATAYQRAKFEQGKLDYTDLQLKTRELLENHHGIQQNLARRHKYFMIDEYQDTNPLQFKLVRLLTNEFKHGNLFIVGDAKQGIYGFRGADIRDFNRTREKILAANGIDVQLNENFRSLRDNVGFVNYFFERLMNEETDKEFETVYESLIQARPGCFRTKGGSAVANGAVEIILGDSGEKNEHQLIATRIKNLIAEKVPVVGRDENGEILRPIAYGDIAILLRSRTYLPEIERALLDNGVPYLTTGGIGFYQRQEIYDIWNYLRFLDAPGENDIALAAVLRGPFFGIPDPELYEISRRAGESFWEKAKARCHPLSSEPGDSRTAVGARHRRSDDSDISLKNLKTAILTLKKHRWLAQRIPINQLILTIVQETGMIGTVATGEQGPQRWANYQKLLDIARNFQQNSVNLDGQHPLTDFIEFLAVLMDEEPRERQAPIHADASPVQIMTIHAAKGRQFPVVILPGLDRGDRFETEPFIDEQFGIGFSPLNPDESYRKTEPNIVKFMKNRVNMKAASEKKRIFYVGATRARDMLILSGTGPDIQMLKQLCVPRDISTQTSLNLPVELEFFSDDSTRRQQFNLVIPVTQSLADNAGAPLGSDEIVSLAFPQPPLPALQPPAIASHVSVTELLNYARCPLRHQLEHILQVPPIRTMSAPRTPGEPNVQADWDRSEKGRAVHYLLSQIRLQSDVKQLEKLMSDYREPIRSEIYQALTTFLTSALGKTALTSEQTYCERQIHAQLGEHIVVGRIDRIFKHPHTRHWQAIDYKTVAPSSASELALILNEYRKQMELYALLLHRSYPEQPEITVTLFFTAVNRCVPMQFSHAELQEVAERWTETIGYLHGRTSPKNVKHCHFCPYADDMNEQCLVTTG